MRVIRGRFAELRVYTIYCLSVFWPGMNVPVFHEPQEFDVDLVRVEDDELRLIIEEGRRQFDRQSLDLERIRTRGATLITVGLIEIAALSGGARGSWDSGWMVSSAWTIATAFVLFGLAGAIAVLTSKAVFGRTDAGLIARTGRNRFRELAMTYALHAEEGESTVAARLTVLRDAVLLLVSGGLVYAAAWPFRI